MKLSCILLHGFEISINELKAMFKDYGEIRKRIIMQVNKFCNIASTICASGSLFQYSTVILLKECLVVTYSEKMLLK